MILVWGAQFQNNLYDESKLQVITTTQYCKLIISWFGALHQFDVGIACWNHQNVSISHLLSPPQEKNKKSGQRYGFEIVVIVENLLTSVRMNCKISSRLYNTPPWGQTPAFTTHMLGQGCNFFYEWYIFQTRCCNSFSTPFPNFDT